IAFVAWLKMLEQASEFFECLASISRALKLRDYIILQKIV
ncbi:18438_t:CDS:1, partial [Gigaspora rosea]